MQRLLCILLLCVAAKPSPAQTYTLLASFNNAGSNPEATLVQGFDGNLYGTTLDSENGDGTIFKVTPEGVLATLYDFTNQNIGYTRSTLIQGTDGILYGTTTAGPPMCSGFCGTIFAITPGGTLTTLHTFSRPDGNEPLSLVQAANGDFYGVSGHGGRSSSCDLGCGTLFKITATGDFVTLHNFDGSDGEVPNGPLIQAYNGNLYGTALDVSGILIAGGTAFRLTAGGAFTTVHSFDPANGGPVNGLVQAADGTFYGTIADGPGTECLGQGCGAVFKLTPSGAFTTLHTFDGLDGGSPNGPLVAATDGNFYSTGFLGGTSSLGTIFKITPAGHLTTLFNFDATTGSPAAGLIQATDGNFYGTTADGGAANAGSVFRFSVGLGPFVKTLPVAGKVGTTVHILGTNLTAPVSVTFNGTPATVTAVSPSQIIATVPSGATTGKVAVTMPTGTLLSNTVFQVRQ